MAPEYSVLLPTYNERENLPLMVALLDRAFEVPRPPPVPFLPPPPPPRPLCGSMGRSSSCCRQP